MIPFYNDMYASEPTESRWLNYLQNVAYLNKIDTIISENRKSLENAITGLSERQAKSINKIWGTLDYGFRHINEHLRNINSNISDLKNAVNDLASMLDWKLSILIEEQVLTNQLLGKIREYQDVPDDEKKKLRYTIQGIKDLKNAMQEGADGDHYDDAFESFKEAEQYGRRDYIILNRIGQIHLFSRKYLNFHSAKEYFLKSAREALGEATARGEDMSHNISPYNYKSLIQHKNPFKAAAVEAFIFAARACYLSYKFKEAAEFAGKAYEVMPEFLLAGFEQAKYLSADHQERKAADILESVISRGRYFAIKMGADKDLNDKNEILQLIEKLYRAAQTEAEALYYAYLRLMIPNSMIKNIMDQISQLLKEKNFLSASKAIDTLRAVHTLELAHHSRIEYKISTYYSKTTGTLATIIDIENESDKNLQAIKLKIAKEKKHIRTFFKILGIIVGLGLIIVIVLQLFFPELLRGY